MLESQQTRGSMKGFELQLHINLKKKKLLTRLSVYSPIDRLSKQDSY